jgi:triosephosphate isomerase
MAALAACRITVAAAGAAAAATSKPSAARPQFSGLRRVELGASSDVAALASQLQSAGRGSRGVVSMAGTGKFFVGGNWKCNGTTESIKKLVEELNSAKLEEDVDVVVSPPYLYISQVIGSLTKRIEVAAQNSWTGKGGAYTGEISAEQLVDAGVQWVIQGHSERRHVIGETNAMIGTKSAYALSKGLGVIACVGEKLEDREEDHTTDVVFEQLQAFADAVSDWSNIVVAYEPVWAIGTGKVATPQQAQEVHAAIRQWLKEKISPEVSSKTRIIYGGSVNGANSAELATQEDIDGFLVGGASLKGPEFATICNAVTAKKVTA